MSTDVQPRDGHLESRGKEAGAEMWIPAWRVGAANLRGNLSLWMLGASVLLFKVWLWYFQFPAGTDIAILGGFLRLKVDYLAGLITFVLGWLVGIYSLKNFQKMMVHFFRPIGLVGDQDTREFFSAPATMIFSFLLFVLVFDVVAANVAYKISTRYDVFLSLPRGSDTFLILPDGKTAGSTLLQEGQSARIALRGRSGSQLLLVRDQYNLVTLDALLFSRQRFHHTVESRKLQGVAPEREMKGAFQGRKAHGIFEIEITNSLRYSPTRVAVTITPTGQGEKRGGWLQPGDGLNCPERTGPAYAKRFFQDLCENRALFSLWASAPAYHEAKDGQRRVVVYHTTGQYETVVQFEKAQIEVPDDLFETREAKEIFAIENTPNEKNSPPQKPRRSQ